MASVSKLLFGVFIAILLFASVSYGTDLQDSSLISDALDFIVIPHTQLQTPVVNVTYNENFIICNRLSKSNATGGGLCTTDFATYWKYYVLTDNTRANIMALNKSCVENLDTVDTQDMWKVNLTSNGLPLNINLNLTDSTLDFDLYLYGPSGTQIASSILGAGQNESISYNIIIAGWYSIKVLRVSGSGFYNLSVSYAGTGDATSTCKANNPFSDTEGTLIKYPTMFGALGVNVSTESYPNDFWCMNTTSKDTGIMYIYASCVYSSPPSPINMYYDSITFNVNTGALSVGITNLDDYSFKKSVGENLSIQPFSNLKIYNFTDLTSITSYAGPSIPAQILYSFENKMNYTVRDIATGARIVTNKNVAPGAWTDNYLIPSTTPIGLIELMGTNNTFSGGRYILYRAIPVTANISINGSKYVETAAGSTVRLKTSLTNYYGNISAASIKFLTWPSGVNTSANITYPNGTTQKINVSSASNTFNLPGPAYNYTIDLVMPSISQTYNVNLSVTHSTGYPFSDSTSINIRPYSIDLTGLEAVYTQGQTITVSAGLLDNVTKVVIPATMNFTFSDPNGIKTFYTDANATVQTNNYHKLNHPLSIAAPLGMWNITVNALDANNLTYTQFEKFNVSELGLNLNVTPTNLAFSITTSATQSSRVNVTNTGSKAFANISLSASSSIKDFVSFDTANITTPLNASNATFFFVKVTPTAAMENRLYNGTIYITADSQVSLINVTMNVSLATVLEINDTFKIELLTIADSADLLVKNSGTKNIENLSAMLIQDTDKIINTTEFSPVNLSTGTQGRWKVYFNILPLGGHQATFNVSAKGIDAKSVLLNVTVFADASLNISALQALVSSLEENITILKTINKLDVSAVEGLLTDLKANLSDLSSSYNNKQYSKALGLLANLQSRAEQIKTAVNALAQMAPQSVSCGDGVCGVGETATTCPTDCGAQAVQRDATARTSGGVAVMIVIVILIIIGVVVIFTSLVPVQAAPKPSPQAYP